MCLCLVDRFKQKRTAQAVSSDLCWQDETLMVYNANFNLVFFSPSFNQRPNKPTSRAQTLLIYSRSKNQSAAHCLPKKPSCAPPPPTAYTDAYLLSIIIFIHGYIYKESYTFAINIHISIAYREEIEIVNR